MAADRLERSDLKAGAILLFFVVLWCVAFGATLWAPSLWAKFVLASLLGLATGLLFIVGHDLAHGSLFKGERANYWGAIIAFLPSFHAPTAWDWVHNRQHHSYTNLTGRDDVHAPPTLEQFQAMSKLKQWAFRAYCTSWGIGLRYIFLIWLPLLIFPPKEALAVFRPAWRFKAERAGLAAFALAQVAVAVAWGAWRGDGIAWMVAEVLLLVLWPFLVWKWLVAFFTLLEHTHPNVRWFDDPTEWSYFDAQMACTVHLVFPRVMEMALSNVSEHNAHHADKRVPLYNLRKSQNMLEERFPGVVPRVDMGFGHLPDVTRRCRLYDYRAHRWMDFDGSYTTPHIAVRGV
jgi:acyl-lipid omega-6 desaturase (Delta-12 desaturase)